MVLRQRVITPKTSKSDYALSGIYIGEGGTIMPTTMTADCDTLDFATLGEATKIEMKSMEMILIAKVSDIAGGFAYKPRQCK